MCRVVSQLDTSLCYKAIDQDLNILPGGETNPSNGRNALVALMFEYLQHTPGPWREVSLLLKSSGGLLHGNRKRIDLSQERLQRL